MQDIFARYKFYRNDIDPSLKTGFIRCVTLTALKTCVLAARPKTLPAAIVPVWVGCVLAWRLSGKFDLLLAICTLVGSIAIQVATNFFNDAIDARKGADTARRLGPTRVTASGMMKSQTVMKIATAFLVVALSCGAVLYQARGWPIIAIGIPSLFLAYGYTGGPFPLAYRGMGELFVIGFFGLIAVSGTVFIQMGEWPREALLLGFQIGLLSAILISINNLRDREEDATTGKRTLAVRFGPKFAVATIWLEVKVAVFSGLGWIAFGHPSLAIAGAPVFLLGLRIIWGVLTFPPGPAFNRLLALGGIQLIFFAAAFHIAAVVIH
ncbi:MAG: 1,4-dihydroxy-2-naphthoate octaprenyltransferase [Akkermansiaceae bacterium]|nr:1,4-dihydroxy-2-naphthoate octaprenyltransferase [Akkermansiaceae bacterium]